jgi:hypothetical protein
MNGTVWLTFAGDRTMRLVSTIAICLFLGCSKKVSETVQIDTPTPIAELSPPPIPAAPILHTDEEVRKIIEKKIYEMNNDCFVLFQVNAYQSVALSQIFKDLNIDERRIEYKGWSTFNYALNYRWKISQSYSLDCSTTWLTDITKNPPFEWDNNPPNAQIKISEVMIYRLMDELPTTQP